MNGVSCPAPDAVRALRVWACVLSLVVAGVGGCGEQQVGTAPRGSADLERLTIRVGALAFDAIAAGPADGEPVLLLHGFPETGWEFHRQVAAVGLATYRAVAPNQRGYSPGARPPAVADYAIDLLVGDVLGMADALGFARFHLVGHDWGAAVAWAVAATAPERILTLNPISVPHPAAFAQVLQDRTSCQYTASAYVDFLVLPNAADVFLANDLALLRDAYAGVPQADVDVHLETLSERAALAAAMNWYRANFNGRSGLQVDSRRTTVPTMFVWSDGDSALCRDGVLLTAQFVDAPYRFEILPGVNHWVPETAPEALTPLLLDHLARRQ